MSLDDIWLWIHAQKPYDCSLALVVIVLNLLGRRCSPISTLPWAWGSAMGLLQGWCACNCGVRTRKQVNGVFNAHVPRQQGTLRGACLRRNARTQQVKAVASGIRRRHELEVKQEEKHREGYMVAQQRDLEVQLSVANRKITDLIAQHTSLRTAGGACACAGGVVGCV